MRSRGPWGPHTPPHEPMSGSGGSVVEDVPADGAPASLVVQNECTDGGTEACPLPVPFANPSGPSLVGCDARAGRPDGVRRGAKVMGGDVSHRNRLARRECRELRRIGHAPGCGIRLEGRSVRLTHGHLTAAPGSTDLEGLSGPAVIWLTVLEQWQHVLGAR